MGLGNKAAPLPSYLSPCSFSLSSLLPHIYLLCLKLMSKPGFHQQWQVSAASREVSLVQQGGPAQPLGSRCLRCSKSSSAASCLEKLLLFSSGTSDEISVSTPQCPLIPVQFLAASFQPRARVNSEGFFPLLSSLRQVTWCHIFG